MIVQKYQLVDEIGSGSFSTVYKAQHTETKKYFAIKKMRQMPHNNFKVVQNQIQLLKRIQHKNIVGYETDFKVKGKWYIVFQYCGKGDLQNFKNKQGKLPQAFCRNLAFSLVDALELLHENKIVHRDLKLANILINDNYDFKLADFGFSKDNELGIMESFCGTPYAMSPEILNREQYDEKCDTWSLGVMIYQLIYGKLPFLPGKQFGHGIIGVTNCIMKSQPKYDSSVEISQEGKDFMKLCLIKNRHERPKMSELKKHSWINGGVESQIRRQILMNSLADKTEAMNRAKELFNGSVDEHIVNLIKHMKLVGEDIKWNLKTISNYFSQNKTIKQTVVMLIAKKIQELMGKVIQIEIDGKKFHIELKQVKSFTTHIQSLKELLSSGIKGVKSQNVYLQRQIISFLAKQSHACLRLTENYPEKIKLLANLSELPIKKLKFSKIQASWSFNEDHIGPRKEFNSYLQSLTYQEIYRFINQSFCEDNIHQNWLVDHKFFDENQEGTQIQLGEFISRVIQINYNEDD